MVLFEKVSVIFLAKNFQLSRLSKKINFTHRFVDSLIRHMGRSSENDITYFERLFFILSRFICIGEVQVIFDKINHFFLQLNKP